MSASPTGLEAEFTRDALLASGRSVHLRPVTAQDVSALRDFYDRLSPASSYSRFFGIDPYIPDRLLEATAVFEPRRHVAMGAECRGRLVGVGEYHVCPGGSDADVAFAVVDEHHHEGIATLLLEDLAVIARAAGVHRLLAETLAGNRAMQEVFRDIGLPCVTHREGATVTVEMSLDEGATLTERAFEREWSASAESVRPLFEAEHVLMVGAGRDPDSVGRRLLGNVARSFTGRISVLHPSADRIDGHPAVRSAGQLNRVPDLAVIAVPAEQVASVVDDCGAAGVPAAVVISAGFAETGPDGRERQQALVRLARHHRMRVVGPNCLGIVVPRSGLNATFVPQELTPGPLAIASQSGGVGIALLSAAAQSQLGVSGFVSIGNKADVSGNDLLRYWADDASTAVIALYLESIGDPRRFARVARTTALRKPIVALKSGTSEGGSRGARSHTAALATDDAAVDALFEHSGVLRARSIDELLDVGKLLSSQPIPTGRRLALVGNAGGPLIIAADQAAAAGLEAPELSPALQARLRQLVPDAAALVNPVDLLATVAPSQMASVVAEIARSGEVDACLIVCVGLGEPLGHETVAPLDRDSLPVPVCAAILGAENANAPSRTPMFPSIDRAVASLSIAARRSEWLASLGPEPASAPVSADLRGRVSDLAGDTPAWLPQATVFELLAEVGMPLTPWLAVSSPAAARRAASRVGVPCVLKADVDGVVHKTAAGAVQLGLRSAAAVGRAAEEMVTRFGRSLRSLVVQQQHPPGTEVLIGAVRHPTFGPLLVVAAGGTATELLHDRQLVMAGATCAEIRRAIERLHLAPLLSKVALDGLVDTARRLGHMMTSSPEIMEVDLNPVIGDEAGCTVVDGRVSVVRSPAPEPLRELRG